LKSELPRLIGENRVEENLGRCTEKGKEENCACGRLNTWPKKAWIFQTQNIKKRRKVGGEVITKGKIEGKNLIRFS